MEKTSKWSKTAEIIPDRSKDAAVEDGAISSSGEDQLHAAELIRNLLCIAGKTRHAALRILLTPLASFCYENGIDVEVPIKLLRVAHADYKKMRSQGELKAVQ